MPDLVVLDALIPYVPPLLAIGYDEDTINMIVAGLIARTAGTPVLARLPPRRPRPRTAPGRNPEARQPAGLVSYREPLFAARPRPSRFVPRREGLTCGVRARSCRT